MRSASVDIGIIGFPIITQVNNARRQCYVDSYSEKSCSEASVNWLAHKALSAISIPLNVVGLGVGLAGAVGGGLTIGSIKIAIFAASLGQIEPRFSTGFLFFGERTVHSLIHLALNVWEVAQVIVDISNQIWRGARWIGEKLHLDHLFAAIFKQFGRIINFAAERIAEGVQKTIESEKNLEAFGRTPSFIRPLDDIAKESRLTYASQGRPLLQVFKHTFVSLLNIPVNSVAFAISTLAGAILSVAFVAKVALNAVTINIPIPTYAAQALSSSGAAIANIALDSGTIFCDVFVVIYKSAEALRITKVAATVFELLAYIPKAIFS